MPLGSERRGELRYTSQPMTTNRTRRQYLSRSPEETHVLGRHLGALLEPGDVVTIRGDLGAGKTALSQGIGVGLEVTEPVSSPTFSLVQEYRGRLPLWHLDVYRLRSPDEVVDLGWSDLLAGGGVVLVEWPERIEASLPPERLDLLLKYGAEEEERLLLAEPRGERMADLVERWLLPMGDK